MTEHPVLVPTSLGLLGGIVTEPESRAMAAVVVLQGAEPRSGTNRIWAELARSLAALGFVVLRLDYPGIGDSDPQPDVRAAYKATPPAFREALTWFMKLMGDRDLMLIGTCYGGRLALDLASDNAEGKPAISAVGLVTPALPTPQRKIPRAALKILRPPARALRKVVFRSSRTYDELRDRVLRPHDPTVQRSLSAATRSASVWMLIGEHDSVAHEALWFISRHQLGATFTVETVQNMKLHTPGAPRVREEVLLRVLSWAREQKDERTRV